MTGLHFDPVTFITILTAVVGAYFWVRSTLTWHTAWIKKHGEECDKREEIVTAVLLELQKSNERLVTLMTTHDDRIDKIDNEIIRLRDRTHDLGSTLQKVMKPI